MFKPLQKLPKNVRDLGKFIVAKGFKKLLKVQKIAQSGHTEKVASFFYFNKRRDKHFKTSNVAMP